MITSTKFNITLILHLLVVENDILGAKVELQKGCKTLPEKQARKLGQVIGALCDIEGFNYRPDLAVRFLNSFDNERKTSRNA